MNVLREGGRTVALGEVEPLIKLTAPFAPHLAEDLWRRVLGRDGSIFDSGPAQTDRVVEMTDLMEMPVQVNGKTKGKVTVSKTAREEEVRVALQAEPAFQNLGEWKKLVYVPGRIVNIVVAQRAGPNR